MDTGITSNPDSFKNLSATERRERLAEDILLGELNQNELAERYGVSHVTISNDKHSAEYKKAQNKTLKKYTLSGLLKMAKACEPRILIYIADKLQLLEPEETTHDNRMAELIAQMSAADPEKEQMRLELAELRERMGALNGKS